jgi:hypothetical protein
MKVRRHSLRLPQAPRYDRGWDERHNVMERHVCRNSGQKGISKEYGIRFVRTTMIYTFRWQVGLEEFGRYNGKSNTLVLIGQETRTYNGKDLHATLMQGTVPVLLVKLQLWVLMRNADDENWVILLAYHYSISYC